MNIIIMSKSAIVFKFKFKIFLLYLSNIIFARFIKTFPKKLQKKFTAKSAFLTVSLFLDFQNPESWGCKYATSFFSR